MAACRACPPVTRRVKIIVRGAEEHFATPRARSIVDYARKHSVGLIVLATPYAAHGLHSRLKATANGRPAIAQQTCFSGDWTSFWHSLTGKYAPTMREKRSALGKCMKVLRHMHRVIQRGKRVLVLCQMGRNRSITLAFMYYIVYHCRGNARIGEALRSFRRWQGVNFDRSLQDKYARLYSARSPWPKAISQIFFTDKRKYFLQR